MNILVIAERPPSPVGGRVRLFGLIRELASQHQFWVAAFAYPVDLAQLDRFDRARAGLTATHIDLGHKATA